MRPNSLKSFTLQISYAENRIAKLPIVCSRAHQKVVPFLTIDYRLQLAIYQSVFLNLKKNHHNSVFQERDMLNRDFYLFFHEIYEY